MSRAVTFTVAEFLRDELAERGWTLYGLAVRMDIDAHVATALTCGWLPVTSDLAERLATATGVDAETWLALQAQQNEANDG